VRIPRTPSTLATAICAVANSPDRTAPAAIAAAPRVVQGLRATGPAGSASPRHTACPRAPPPRRRRPPAPRRRADEIGG
jgi:hypothetical protein